MKQILGIRYGAIQEAWNTLAPMIQMAIDRSEGELTLEAIKKAVELREMQLWVIIDGKKLNAVVVTEISVFPSYKVANVVVVGGEGMQDWLDLVHVLEAWAVENGCSKLRTICRPGVTRRMKDKRYGYSKVYDVISKDLP